MAQTVIGIFNNAGEAENAKQQLLSNGFSDSNVDIANGNAAEYTYRDHEHEHESGIARFFKNLFGGDDEQRERYTRIAERGYVVTVHAQSKEDAELAASLLDDYGAVDIDENYRKYIDNNSGWSTESGATIGSGTGVGTPMGDTYVDTDQTTSGIVSDRNIDETRPNRKSDGSIFEDDRNNVRGIVEKDIRRDDDRRIFNKDREYSDATSKTIPIIEEQIEVGKREVETGGVRVKSRIVEKPVEENLRLRQEHVTVERNAVNREATRDDLDNFKEETFELREVSEEPVVSKKARVVEEVFLNKEVEHRDESINDTIRNTEVDVEDLERKRKRDE